MKLWLLVPLKPFGEGKSRLSPVLPATRRAALSQQLFQHLIAQARASTVLAGTIVVSRDRSVMADIHDPKIHFLPEAGTGLNQALAQGRQAALAHGADALLVLPADLPYVTTADIALLHGLGARQPAVVLVPSADNGTNALLLHPPTAIDFAFGPNSFDHHRHAAQRAGIASIVHTSTTLAFDLDNPRDLARFTPSRALQSAVCASPLVSC